MSTMTMPIDSARRESVFTAADAAKRLEKQLLVSPENKTVNSALRTICYILHELAQKYVTDTPNTYSDYACLVHCTQLLQNMGLKPETNYAIDAAVNDLGAEIIHNSFEYRHLRNKIMASLSIIADLTDRPSAAGHAEYRRGMREGYRRASDIAITFLQDISGGE